MAGDYGPQRWRQAADALAPSRRQDQHLELSSDVVCLAVSKDEGDTAGRLERPLAVVRASSRLSGRRLSVSDQPLTTNDSMRRLRMLLIAYSAGELDVAFPRWQRLPWCPVATAPVTPSRPTGTNTRRNQSTRWSKRAPIMSRSGRATSA